VLLIHISYSATQLYLDFFFFPQIFFFFFLLLLLLLLLATINADASEKTFES
jgi:hypothetical protein